MSVLTTFVELELDLPINVVRGKVFIGNLTEGRKELATTDTLLHARVSCKAE